MARTAHDRDGNGNSPALITRELHEIDHCACWMQSKIAVVRSLAERPAESLRDFMQGYIPAGTQFEVVYNALQDHCPSNFLEGAEATGSASWAPPNYCELF
jgi:hypothetical protein